MPGRSKLGLFLALVAVLAIVAWTLLPEEQLSLDEAQATKHLVEEGEAAPAVSSDGPLKVDPAEADRSEAQVESRPNSRPRRGKLDSFAMPFPFSGQCVDKGRPVAGATVQYEGETRTTDANGEFSFPSYGYALRVIVEADGYGQLITVSDQADVTIQMQPPTTGRVIVLQDDHVVEGAKVSIYLLPEIVKVWNERFLLRELPLVAVQETDAQGEARFAALPTFDGRRDRSSDMLLHCLVEYPDGEQREETLYSPREVAVPGGSPRKEWRLDCRRDGSPTPDLRIEKRDEFGARVPVANQLVYFRVNSRFYTPWHAETTDAHGLIEIKEWDAGGLQVFVPLSKSMHWSSESDPLIDLGSVLVALIEMGEQSVRLHGAPEGASLRFQVQRVASAKRDAERAPGNGGGLVRLSEWGWQDCTPGERTPLNSGWAGANSWVWVRMQPGNIVVGATRLNAEGITDVQLPELSRLTVKVGEGQRFPLGARFWLMDRTPTRLNPIILDPRGSNSVEAFVPYGDYQLALVTTGMQQRNLGNLRVDAVEQEYTIELPQSESTLKLSLGSHALADCELFLDGESAPLRSNAQGELELRGSLQDSFLVRIPASKEVSELKLSGQPELVFLGYEAYLAFAAEGMHLDIPLGTLSIAPHAEDGGKLRLTRRDSVGAKLASVECTFPEAGGKLTRSLPVGRYEIETRCRKLQFDIKPHERVQVDADDR